MSNNHIKSITEFNVFESVKIDFAKVQDKPRDEAGFANNVMSEDEKMQVASESILGRCGTGMAHNDIISIPTPVPPEISIPTPVPPEIGIPTNPLHTELKQLLDPKSDRYDPVRATKLIVKTINSKNQEMQKIGNEFLPKGASFVSEHLLNPQSAHYDLKSAKAVIDTLITANDPKSRKFGQELKQQLEELLPKRK